MTSFADCLDLPPDLLTEGQIKNFLAYAEEKKAIPADAADVLGALMRDARDEIPAPEKEEPEETVAYWASVAYATVGSDGFPEFERWARDRTEVVVASGQPSTTSVALHLATPTALRRGLRLFGLYWSPRAYAREDLVARDHDTEPGLYCWVTAGPRDSLDGGVLYIGIGDGRTGWRSRLRDEWGWIGAEADHGHGMAMHRTNASVVGGPVTYVARPLGWLARALGDGNVGGIPLITGYVGGIGAGGRLTSTKAAEAIAIRLAIHLGDTGAPVNSAGAGAWATNRPEDWAGYAAARFMLP